MKCKYCGMYLENVDEESPNGMAHTIKCQTKRIHELENEKAAQIGVKPHDKYLIQLSHCTPRCGMCGKMTSNDKKRIKNNIPYCPDCYRKIMQEDYVRQYDKTKGETYDDN